MALLRAAAPASAGRRTQMVTRRQLDEALEALAPALDPDAVPDSPDRLVRAAARRSPAGSPPWSTWRGRWRESSARGRTPRPGARPWPGPSWRWPSAESHARDLDELAPAASASEAGGLSGLTASGALARRLAELSRTASELFDEMDFSFLYDPARKLFAIGYHVAEGELDRSYYDLLASEARLASFVAIAKGDVPVAHWFQLGRPLTPGRPRLGAHLLVGLDVRVPDAAPGDALARRQPARPDLPRWSCGARSSTARERGVPWGISESAFNARDLELTYQYSNFGVPGLGLKRGLGEDLVVAPYATALAAMVEPRAAVPQLRAPGDAGAARPLRLLRGDRLHRRPRCPKGSDRAVVRAYMAHHQGMTLVALANVLAATSPCRARFHAEPIVQATELLLQERTPRDVAVARPRAEEVDGGGARRGAGARRSERRYHSPHHADARGRHLLSNGRYAVMLTTAGSGYSRCARASPSPAGARTRPATLGHSTSSSATSQSGEVWSAGYQPSGVEPDSYEVAFSEDRAEIVRRDGAIDDAARGHRLARGRRRGPPRLAHQPRRRGRARSS